MDRRKFLGSAAVAAGATLLPRSAHAAKKQRWRMALAVPRTLPIWGSGMEQFAKLVEELSDGALRIKVYGAGELVPALGTFEAVRAGDIQMGHSAAYYWQGKIAASPFFTSVPFGMNLQGNLAWLSGGDGQTLYDELMSPHGVTCLPCGATGYQMFGWFNREIKTVKDLEGLKIRIPGLAGKVLSLAGAKPVLLPGGEVFTGLSTGVIDAVEWVGPYHDYIMGFHKAAKYYYGTSWHEPGAVLELMINRKAWDTLESKVQSAVRLAASHTTAWMEAQWSAKNGEYLEKIRKEGKVQIAPLPEEVLQKLRQLSDTVKSDIAKSGPLAKKIYDSYTAFQKQYEEYIRLAGGFYPAALSG